MTELEKLVVRCWSAVVARGEEGLPHEVAAEMRTCGTPCPHAWKVMLDLRVRGALPT